MRLIVSAMILTFTLISCGGGGGSGADISKLNSVTTNLRNITYPDSYQVPTTDKGDVNTNACKLNVDTVTFPRSWLGNYPLPEINGAPLQSTITRAMSVRDIMLHDNPSFIEGCTGDLLEEYDSLLDRFSILGNEVVYLPQWHWISARNDGSWYVVPADKTYGPVSDSDLSYFVDQARARGMKIAMFNQIQGFVDDDKMGTPAYEPEYTSENLAKWFAAYQDFVAERSVFFESIGIDIWEVGCSVCLFAPYLAQNQAELDLHAQEYEKAIDAIRTNFSGQILSFFNPIDEYPTLLSKVDLLGGGLWFDAYSEDEMTGLTAESFKSTLIDDGNQNNIERLQSMGKPIFFVISIQSRENALTDPGYLEETQCTAGFGDLVGSQNECLQRKTDPDFSLQAIYLEAAFEFLNSQAFSNNPTIMIGDYWVTDSIEATNVFPNIGLSFRNKPAEGIVKAWFAK